MCDATIIDYKRQIGTWNVAGNLFEWTSRSRRMGWWTCSEHCHYVARTDVGGYCLIAHLWSKSGSERITFRNNTYLVIMFWFNFTILILEYEYLHSRWRKGYIYLPSSFFIQSPKASFRAFAAICETVVCSSYVSNRPTSDTRCGSSSHQVVPISDNAAANVWMISLSHVCGFPTFFVSYLYSQVCKGWGQCQPLWNQSLWLILMSINAAEPTRTNPLRLWWSLTMIVCSKSCLAYPLMT